MNAPLPPILPFDEYLEATRAFVDPPPFRSKFRAIRWEDLDLPGVEHEWLVKNVITRRELTMIAGASGSGKSFLAIDIAMAISRGVPWFGNRALKGGVVYNAGEGGRGVKKRLRAYRAEHGLSPADPLPFVLLPATIDLYSGGDAAADALIAEVRHWASTFDCPLELIVIDTFSTATPGADENSAKDVGPILDRCARIGAACNSSVMLVHHMNSGGLKPRGHTSILANIDSVLKVEKLEEMDIDKRAIREIEIAKEKDGEAGKKWRFVLPAVEIGRDDEGDPITSCVVRAPNDDGEPGETSKATDAGIKLSPQCEIFLKAVYRAIGDYGEDAPPSLNVPAGTRVVHWKQLCDVFAGMAWEGADEPDDKKRANKISQSMKRHGEKLVQLRIIMRENPYVWVTGRRVRGFARRADTAGEIDDRRGREEPAPVVDNGEAMF
jgi:hypothetical protein